MSLTAYERETIIRFSDDGNFAIVYTCQRPMMTKLDKLCKTSKSDYKMISCDEDSKTYICPKNLISFRSAREKREYTEEQLLAMKERMSKMHSARINSTVQNMI